MITCASCGKSFQAGENGSCPYCGEPVSANNGGGVVRTSAILISVGGTERLYRSVDEIPPVLRRQLARSTSSVNSGTILIADRRGRQELARAIRNLPATAQRRALQAVLAGEAAVSSGRITLRLRGALALGLGALALALIWLLFGYKA